MKILRELRQVQRCWIGVCENGDTVALSEPEWSTQIRCKRGHWTWADGMYCGHCGHVL